MEKGNSVYHERQRLQLCLLHSLNNLFQEKDAFTRAGLNLIAEKLDLRDPNKTAWTPLSAIFKPHHNTLTGNYDVNVLIDALEEKDKKLTWRDRRLGEFSIDLDGTKDVLNMPLGRYGGIWESSHWVALRRGLIVFGTIWIVIFPLPIILIMSMRSRNLLIV